jgi:hypothetical protein
MDDEAGAAEIEAEFEDWHVWMSDTGRWWAARKATLTAAESSSGCAQYLESDSPGGLRDQIAAEETLSTRMASPENWTTSAGDVMPPGPRAGRDKPTPPPGKAEGPQ